MSVASMGVLTVAFYRDHCHDCLAVVMARGLMYVCSF